MNICTAQKKKFSIEDFFSKLDQIRRKLRIWPHLLKKFLMENLIFCAMLGSIRLVSKENWWNIPYHFEVTLCNNFCIIHWYRYSLFWGRSSRNIVKSAAYFLKSCAISCWWHIWCCLMTVILNAGGFFFGPGSLKNGR